MTKPYDSLMVLAAFDSQGGYRGILFDPTTATGVGQHVVDRWKQNGFLVETLPFGALAHRMNPRIRRTIRRHMRAFLQEEGLRHELALQAAALETGEIPF